MSEYEVKTTSKNREEVMSAIHALGVVTQKWEDGTFNFQCYDNNCEDELIETLEALNVECELI